MHIFRNANEKWWRKPLVMSDAGPLPAELAILAREIKHGEDGVWINSRSTTTGVCGLSRKVGKVETIRKELPDFISVFLASVYENEKLSSGCPDLVIWNNETRAFRFVEVKCPLWDRPTKQQYQFMAFAASEGIETMISEWVFEDSGDSATKRSLDGNS